jgi:hypothetical protein
VTDGSDKIRRNLGRRPLIPDPTSRHHLGHRQALHRAHPGDLPIQTGALVMAGHRAYATFRPARI